jgi:DNA oxidative demethylase
MSKIDPHRSQPKLPLADNLPFPLGFNYLPTYFDDGEQVALLASVRAVLARAPLFQQVMPRTGARLSVRMSNAGEFGWVSDREGGYRYQTMHPVSGDRWPSIPQRLLRLWHDLTQEDRPPNLCLINYYDEDARLGLHQDRGDASLDAPVVSVSLGDEATFVLGGLSRKDPVQRLLLRSGDVAWFGGPSRLIYHGVEGIQLGTSQLLPEGGRLNLTLRRIEKSQKA